MIFVWSFASGHDLLSGTGNATAPLWGQRLHGLIYSIPIDSQGEAKVATMEGVRPAWYTEEDDDAWDRIKEAFQRDWQQTKVDLGGREPNLNQQIGDTLGQAAGIKPIPSANRPTPHPNDYSYSEDHDHAYKYGYSAYRHYGKNGPWGEKIEAQLRRDWTDEGEWKRERHAIRRGWDYAEQQSRGGS